MMPGGTPMLEIEGLHVKYGGIHALKGISVKVEEKNSNGSSELFILQPFWRQTILPRSNENLFG